MFKSDILFFKPAKLKVFIVIVLMIYGTIRANSQTGEIRWANDGNSYYRIEKNELVQYTLPDNKPVVVLSKQMLIPAGSSNPLQFSYFAFSADQQKILVFTNTKRVWRLNTKGDYWVLDRVSGTLNQIGKTLPGSTLMFAKFSPDGRSVAYVSGNNIYTEDLATSKIKALTTDGTLTLINGTFDWAY